MLKNEKSLKELIRGVINDEYQWIGKLCEYIYPLIKNYYRNNFVKKYGEGYRADLENRCLHKIIKYIGKFKGNTWGAFKAYNLRIINSAAVDFFLNDIKPFHYNCTQFDTKALENAAYELEDYDEYEDGEFEQFSKLEIIEQEKKSEQVKEAMERWPSILVESFELGLNLAKLIFSKLTEREINLIKSFARHSSLLEYSKENNCSYTAAKQRKYRLRLKIDKIKGRIDPKTYTWEAI